MRFGRGEYCFGCEFFPKNWTNFGLLLLNLWASSPSLLSEPSCVILLLCSQRFENFDAIKNASLDSHFFTLPWSLHLMWYVSIDAWMVRSANAVSLLYCICLFVLSTDRLVVWELRINQVLLNEVEVFNRLVSIDCIGKTWWSTKESQRFIFPTCVLAVVRCYWILSICQLNNFVALSFWVHDTCP